MSILLYNMFRSRAIQTNSIDIRSDGFYIVV